MDDTARDLLFLCCIALTPTQREVIVDRHLLGRSQAAIAKDMGCHHTNVQKIEARAAKQIHRLLGT